jgi:hypothetical protein
MRIFVAALAAAFSLTQADLALANHTVPASKSIIRAGGSGSEPAVLLAQAGRKQDGGPVATDPTIFDRWGNSQKSETQRFRTRGTYSSATVRGERIPKSSKGKGTAKKIPGPFEW